MRREGEVQKTVTHDFLFLYTGLLVCHFFIPPLYLQYSQDKNLLQQNYQQIQISAPFKTSTNSVVL